MENLCVDGKLQRYSLFAHAAFALPSDLSLTHPMSSHTFTFPILSLIPPGEREWAALPLNELRSPLLPFLNVYTFAHSRKILKIKLNINFTSVEIWEKGSKSIFPDYESSLQESEIRTEQEFEWQKK